MIYEDEDDIGYWGGGPNTARPDGWWRGNANVMSSMIVCNAILPPADQAIIVDAAVNANEGYFDAAEELRRFADYENLDTRPDADCV